MNEIPQRMPPLPSGTYQAKSAGSVPEPKPEELEKAVAQRLQSRFAAYRTATGNNGQLSFEVQIGRNGQPVFPRGGGVIFDDQFQKEAGQSGMDKAKGLVKEQIPEGEGSGSKYQVTIQLSNRGVKVTVTPQKV